MKIGPIVAALIIGDSWDGPPSNIVADQLGANAGWHAIVIVGFDDGKGLFRIRKSWGQDWANGGYAWMSYGGLQQGLGAAIALQFPL